jgi:hypothetical protein
MTVLNGIGVGPQTRYDLYRHPCVPSAAIVLARCRDARSRGPIYAPSTSGHNVLVMILSGFSLHASLARASGFWRVRHTIRASAAPAPPREAYAALRGSEMHAGPSLGDAEVDQRWLNADVSNAMDSTAQVYVCRTAAPPPTALYAARRTPRKSTEGLSWIAYRRGPGACSCRSYSGAAHEEPIGAQIYLRALVVPTTAVFARPVGRESHVVIYPSDHSATDPSSMGKLSSHAYCTSDMYLFPAALPRRNLSNRCVRARRKCF